MSFTHRPVAAICYEVEPVDGPARSTVQSELTANEQLPPAGADPRVAAALEDPLRGEYHDATGTAVVLVHKTRRSGLRVGAAIDHLVDCPAPVRAESRSFADGGLVTAAMVLASGQKLRVIKFGVEVPRDTRPRDSVGACEQGHATARERLSIPARAMRSHRRGENVVTITSIQPRSTNSARAMMHSARIFKPGSASTSPSRSAVRLSLCRTPTRR